MENSHSLVKVDLSDLIGRPYKNFARGPDCYDCWGIIIEVGKRFGVVIHDYCISPVNNSEIIKQYNIHSSDYLIVKDNLQPADIIMFKRTDGGLHFGIVIDDKQFIHTLEGLGVHICRLNHRFYKSLIHSFYRVKNV